MHNSERAGLREYGRTLVSVLLSVVMRAVSELVTPVFYELAHSKLSGGLQGIVLFWGIFIVFVERHICLFLISSAFETGEIQDDAWCTTGSKIVCEDADYQLILTRQIYPLIVIIIDSHNNFRILCVAPLCWLFVSSYM